MRIVIVTMGSEGDVRPYIALARALKQQDYQVSLATSDNFSDLVTRSGIDYLRMQQYYGDPPTWINLRLLLAVRSAIEIKDGYLSELWRVCQQADALIYNVSTYPCYYIAEKLGIPSFGAFVQPHHASWEFPHPMVTGGRPVSGLFNRAQFWLFSMLHWRHVRRSINKWRRDTLQLPALPAGEHLLKQLKHNDPHILYAYSPILVPRPAGWRSKRLQITGYWYMDTVSEYIPSPDLDRFLKDGPPPVVISVLWNLDKFDWQCLQKIGSLLDRRIVIHDLRGGLGEMKTEGNLFYVKGPIPHEWLFKRVAVAVHHGGLGITMNCIRAGIPMVTIPAVGVNDHRFWAYCVSRSGIGIHLTASMGDKHFPEKVAGAVARLLKSEKVRARVRELSNSAGNENGLANAVKIISTTVNQFVVNPAAINQ